MSKGLFDKNELRFLSGVITEKTVLEESLKEAPIANSRSIEPLAPYHMEYVLKRADELLSSLNIVKSKAQAGAIYPEFKDKFPEQWGDFKRILMQIGMNAQAINKSGIGRVGEMTEDSSIGSLSSLTSETIELLKSARDSLNQLYHEDDINFSEQEWETVYRLIDNMYNSVETIDAHIGQHDFSGPDEEGDFLPSKVESFNESFMHHNMIELIDVLKKAHSNLKTLEQNVNQDTISSDVEVIDYWDQLYKEFLNISNMTSMIMGDLSRNHNFKPLIPSGY